MKRILFTLAVVMMALPILAVSGQQENGTPEFAQFWKLIYDTYNGDGAGNGTDPGTGMKRIVYESETDSEEGIEMQTIIFGKGTKAVKKKTDYYTEWVCEAVDAHACYVRFHFDTDNGAILAFKDKADAEACARQMKPFLQQNDTDMEYGSATIGGFYCANVEPRQNEDGWWIFDFHAG